MGAIVHVPAFDTVAFMFERVPELRSAIDQDSHDLPYYFFGNVAIYLQNADVDPLIEAATYSAIHTLALMEDPIIDNLLVVGFFEMLIADEKTEEKALSRFQGRARQLLEKAGS